MSNENRDDFAATISGIEISAKQGRVAVKLDGTALLDDDDVQAVIKALDTANTVVSLGA